ncbi:ABC transporter substrate-binding protein [Peredibacter sp. HCB2-198]|uniref:ABC transporter substrate-binding protein n=1 Tax=Peredibacter sp. HCB2-198 TaxID=3383025 RepID=UPI0038B6A60F
MVAQGLRTFLVIALIALVGCQGKSKKSGSTIYYNIGGEPTTLNPMTASDGYTQAVHAYLFDSLLDRDLDTYEWKPALATEWKISEDKRTFDFKLREGVKFHDGKEVTAEDVKYSYDVIFTEDFKAVQLRSFYEAVKEVQVLDKYNVRFIVKDDYFQNFDVCAGITVLPKHFYSNPENKKEFGRKVVGSGPYMFTKYDKGQKIILVQNPDWWGRKVETEKNSHTIPKIVLRFVSEENVSLELLKKGDIDFLALRPEGFVKKTVGKIWDEKIVKVKTENKSPKGYNFIGWNFKHPILKDREVRKALYMLFNRPLMLDKFEYNLSEYATGPIYVQSDYASPNVRPVEFNPNEALKILRQAGWKDTDKDGLLDKVINGKKTPLSITILEPTQEMAKYLTIFKEDASKVGVEINIKNIEWNSFVKLLDEKNFEAVRLAWGGGGVDWDPKQIWHTSSSKGAGSNFIQYSNQEVDRLIDEARKLYEKEQRLPLLRKVHELISADYPYVWWFNSKYTLYGHTKRVVKPKDTFTYGIGQQYWKLQ